MEGYTRLFAALRLRFKTRNVIAGRLRAGRRSLHGWRVARPESPGGLSAFRGQHKRALMRRRLCPKEALFTPSFIAVCSANLLFFIASFMMVPVLPIYLLDGLRAQARWQELLGEQHSYYCGAYWANGFHEEIGRAHV